MTTFEFTPRYTANIDGGCRNPGLASSAYVLERDGATDGRDVHFDAKLLPAPATNNIAEYSALVMVLEAAVRLGIKHLTVRSDSKLVVEQVGGTWAVKNATLEKLWAQAIRLTAKLDFFTIVHVPREQNKEADQLCNEVMDAA